MPDVFITYSSHDSPLANWIRDQLVAVNVSTFLAEVSIAGGTNWKPEILKNLRESSFVLFLATANSCRSDAVKHEIGGALVLQKTFIAIMAGIRLNQLPAWVQDKQAVDIRDSARTRDVFESIANTVRSKRFIAGLIVGILAGAAIYCLVKGNGPKLQ
jgi:hypothetical protein